MHDPDIQPLAAEALPQDQVGLLEGLATTRAIRRYAAEPIPERDLRAILFGATRGPSGSNRQPFRFVVLTDTPRAKQAKALIGEAARALWAAKFERDGYAVGSGANSQSPKARMARTMDAYVARFEQAPVLVLPCLVRYREPSPMEGASVYPAVQNLLLSARALGYGGVITGFHGAVEAELKTLLDIPSEVFIAATVTLGKPAGKHGPVRRRPMSELVFGDTWDQAPIWAVDPPGTEFTRAGPPTPVNKADTPSSKP
jgi:nitroreductase